MLVLCLVQAWILQKEDSSLSGVGEGGRLTPLEVGVGPVLGLRELQLGDESPDSGGTPVG